MANESIIVIGDLHFPWVKQAALNRIYEAIKIQKPKYVVQIGDLYDQYNFSKYTKDNDILSANKELAKARKMAEDMWKKIQLLSPKSKCYQLKGNHDCVEETTELLTYSGWKVASEINEKDLVANFDVSTKEIKFNTPIAITHFTNNGGYKIIGDMNEEIVNPTHRILTTSGFTRACDFEKQSQTNLIYSGLLNSKSVSTNPDLLRLMTWVVCDGTIVDRVKYGETGKRIQFKLSKERKIKRLQELLTSLNIKFTFKPATKSETNKLQPYYIRIYGKDAEGIFDLLNGKKEFPYDWRYLNLEQLKAVLEEIENTDGSRHFNHMTFHTIRKYDADTIQLSCIFNDIPCKITNIGNNSGFQNGNIQYRVDVFDRGLSKARHVHTEQIKGDINFVGIQMPLDTIITRTNGKVSITGNCRIIKRIAEKVPEALGLVSKELDRLYCFNNVTTMGSDRDELYLDGMLFIHGYLSKIGDHCKKNLAKTVVGHSHTGGTSFYKIRNNMLWELNCGYVADEKAGPLQYGQQRSKNWTLGYGLITKINGIWCPQFVPIKLDK